MFQINRINRLSFFYLRILVIFPFLFMFNFTYAEPGDHEYNDEDSVIIQPDMAKKVGIETRQVGPGTIQTSVTVYGKIINDPDQVSHLSARFPGIISNVYVDIGDEVKAGEKLIEIESNASLTNYIIKAPISGRITARNAEMGEFSQSKVLLTIENFRELWTELEIFPNQISLVKPGDKVVITANGQMIKSTLSHLIPNEQNKPFIFARAKINNQTQEWVPGLFVKGKVITQRINADLVVANSALHRFEGQTVVFIQEKNSYEAKPVKLGKRDETYTEILSGLKQGDLYVAENSYLIKADLEKSNASHEH